MWNLFRFTLGVIHMSGFPRRLENLENENENETWKIGQKSWNFVISHQILPILPPELYRISFFCGHHLEIKQRSRKSAFSEVFRKTPGMQKREGRWSWKINKWSWKSHEKIFCGNPDMYIMSSLLFNRLVSSGESITRLYLLFCIFSTVACNIYRWVPHWVIYHAKNKANFLA